jgi:hypothetical protein
LGWARDETYRSRKTETKQSCKRKGKGRAIRNQTEKGENNKKLKQKGEKG